MIANFWVSCGLLMGVLAIHVMVPPLSRLLRVPDLSSNWIVGGLGIGLGAGRFWTLFIPISEFAFAGGRGLIPAGWFGLAGFAALGLVTLSIYMAWIGAITGTRRNYRLAAILAPIYVLIVCAETVYVHELLFR